MLPQALKWGISSAQLKAGKHTLLSAAANVSFYIQFLQHTEDGSSWQGAPDWEAAFWCLGSLPGDWISTLLDQCITKHPSADSPQSRYAKVVNSYQICSRPEIKLILQCQDEQDSLFFI